MMKITLNIEKEELAWLVGHLENANDLLGSEKAMLTKILTHIKFSYSLDELIFTKVETFLKSLTNATIKLKSNLKFGLGINQNWLSNSLHNYCNIAVNELISEAGTKLTAEDISKDTAAKCETVEDIVKLIKKTYESAA